MKQVWIGIDAGGTQSRIAMVDNELNTVSQQTHGPLQASEMELRTVAEQLTAWIGELREREPENELQGIAMALAGGGRESYRVELEHLLKQHYDQQPLLITSDAKAAHTGAFDGKDGLLIMAGTGSLVLGRHEKQWFRAGGYGPRIGDAGGAGQLGAGAVRAACEAWDGGPRTTLTRLLDDQYGINSHEMVLERIYRHHTPPAAFAPMLLEAVPDDPVAEKILQTEVSHLAQQVEWVAKRMEIPKISCALHGGLFKSDAFKNRLLDQIYQYNLKLELHQPKHPPTVGAVFMLLNS